MKIVLNACYGGFHLSMEALTLYFQLQGKTVWLKQERSGFIDISLVPFEQRTDKTWSYEEQQEKSEEFTKRYTEETMTEGSIERNDPTLVQVVETLGSEKASGVYSKLKIIEIPDDVDWMIQDYDGQEWVAEKHRVWK